MSWRWEPLKAFKKHLIVSSIFIWFIEMELFQTGHLFLALRLVRCRCMGFFFLLGAWTPCVWCFSVGRGPKMALEIVQRLWLHGHLSGGGAWSRERLVSGC